MDDKSGSEAAIQVTESSTFLHEVPSQQWKGHVLSCGRLVRHSMPTIVHSVSFQHAHMRKTHRTNHLVKTAAAGQPSASPFKLDIGGELGKGDYCQLNSCDPEKGPV